MKITIDNLVEQYPKINVSLPKELNKDEFQFIKENLDLYDEDETIKELIDTFILKLNEVVAKDTKKPVGKKKEVKQEKKEKVKPQPKPVSKKEKEIKPVVPVEHFTLEERFIKRYLLLDGKTKTKGQVLNFIKSLQRAITEKQIRKTSKYADIIERMQKSLIKLFNGTPDSVEGIKITLEQKTIDELKKIVGDKRVRLSVTYIKRFIGLYGRETKEKAKRLQDLISKAVEKGKILTSDPSLSKSKSYKKP